MDITQCWYKNRCNQLNIGNCTKACVRYNCMESMYEKSYIPQNLWNYKDLVCGKQDYEAFCRLSDICRNINTFVTNGSNLYLYSKTCGNGKTSWSVRMMFSWFDSMWHRSGFDCHGLFISVPKFLYDHKRNINQTVEGFEELCNLIQTVELVIWDDLPSRTLTEYEHQILLQFIDERINAGLSNIYTGNCDRNECANRLGERLTSRIFGCGDIIELKEQDKRQVH